MGHKTVDSLHSARAETTIPVMSLSLLSRRPVVSGFATVLLAVMFLLQACAGYASPLPGNITTAASVAAESCCDTRWQPGCSGLNVVEAADSCVRHCAQPSHRAPSQTAVSASSLAVYGPDLYIGKVIFFAQRPPLNIAPRAISSTPLIYHLQRLLN